MSAKMLRFKQLQNQLADAHYHLNELANENRLLKALQKRQDSALRRYEGTNAELPRLINSHHEELRVLQTKYKKLKDLHKDTCNLLKEKENELYSVNSQNKHLLQLSKDRHLEEREKLQLHLLDMNHKMQQQHETIQLLHRKLALETKSLKHQLHVEISKHKETQKNLQETIEKLKNLECLLDNREKRLYNGQVPICTKQKNLGSHSLTNLSITNPTKASSRNKRSENDIPRDNLPSLDILESNNDGKVIQATNDVNDHSMNQLKSETMASLQQIRKFRLQRSSNMRKNAYSMDDIRFRPKDTETKTHNNEKITLVDSKVIERDDLNDNNESGKLRKLFSKIKSQNLQKELKIEFNYSSDDKESDSSEHYIEPYLNTAHKSRELYAKLISSADDTSDTLDNMMKRTDHYSNEEEEELNTDLMKDLACQKHLQESKLKVLQHYKNKNIYDSDSEDSEEKMDINGDTSTEYKMNEFQINSSKYAKEQFSKSFNDTNQQEYIVSEIRDQISKEITGRLQNTELQRISDDTLDDIHTENAEATEQSSKAEKIWLEDRQLSKNNGIDHFSTDIKKEDHSKEEEAKYSENKTIYSDSSHGNHETLEQNNVYDEIKSLPSPERKDTKKNSQQTYEKESVTNDSDGNNQSTHNLEKEYLKSRIEEMLSTTQHSDKEILNKDNFNVETKNKLNTSLEADVSTLSNNAHVSHQNEQSNGTKTEITNTKQSNEKKKVINYNKEKLLATMRAIDDNENIEFLNQGFRNHNINRMQITENLYRGLPAHSKPKRDIIKDIFEDNHIENKVRGTCSKSH
nr:PREDICTED: thyroid receptor-interacting protein 11 [Linepithema humile]